VPTQCQSTMKVAIQSGLKLASNAPIERARPTAHRIAAKPAPCEFDLPNGGSLHVCNPAAFATLRELAGVDHNSFFNSLTHQDLVGGRTEASGKSGSLFWYSQDGRFVLKTVKESELQTLLTILPKYARHLVGNRDSLLTRYFGAYRVIPTTGGDEVRMVVMNNVLEGARQHKVYDLKGTTEDRWVEEQEGKCLKDVNFQPFTLHINAEVNRQLHEVLEYDAQFLQRLGIMDYSLILSIQHTSKDANASFHQKPISKLMGGLRGSVHCDAGGDKSAEGCILHIGMVDMLTTFGFKKQVAHTLKANTIKHFYEIDTEPPDVYAERFTNYMKQKIVSEAENGKPSEKPPQVASAPVDLLVFDTPAVPAPAALHEVSSAASPSGSTCMMEDLLDLGVSVDTASKSMPSMNQQLDLLSMDLSAAPYDPKSGSLDLLA